MPRLRIGTRRMWRVTSSSRLSSPCPFATALELAQSLEARWFRLAVAPDGWLLVTPATRLTDADRAAIRRHRAALVQLVRETPESVSGGLRFTVFDPTRAFLTAEEAAERQGRLVRPPAGAIHA